MAFRVHSLHNFRRPCSLLAAYSPCASHSGVGKRDARAILFSAVSPGDAIYSRASSLRNILSQVILCAEEGCESREMSAVEHVISCLSLCVCVHFLLCSCVCVCVHRCHHVYFSNWGSLLVLWDFARTSKLSHVVESRWDFLDTTVGAQVVVAPSVTCLVKCGRRSTFSTPYVVCRWLGTRSLGSVRPADPTCPLGYSRTNSTMDYNP